MKLLQKIAKTHVDIQNGLEYLFNIGMERNMAKPAMDYEMASRAKHWPVVVRICTARQRVALAALPVDRDKYRDVALEGLYEKAI